MTSSLFAAPQVPESDEVVVQIHIQDPFTLLTIQTVSVSRLTVLSILTPLQLEASRGRIPLFVSGVEERRQHGHVDGSTRFRRSSLFTAQGAQLHPQLVKTDGRRQHEVAPSLRLPLLAPARSWSDQRRDHALCQSCCGIYLTSIVGQNRLRILYHERGDVQERSRSQSVCRRSSYATWDGRKGRVRTFLGKINFRCRTVTDHSLDGGTDTSAQRCLLVREQFDSNAGPNPVYFVGAKYHL